jgi:hypothetical protein
MVVEREVGMGKEGPYIHVPLSRLPISFETSGHERQRWKQQVDRHRRHLTLPYGSVTTETLFPDGFNFRKLSIRYLQCVW